MRQIKWLIIRNCMIRCVCECSGDRLDGRLTHNFSRHKYFSQSLKKWSERSNRNLVNGHFYLSIAVHWAKFKPNRINFRDTTKFISTEISKEWRARLWCHSISIRQEVIEWNDDVGCTGGISALRHFPSSTKVKWRWSTTCSSVRTPPTICTGQQSQLRTYGA